MEEIRFARRVSLRAKPDRIPEFLSRMKESVFPGLRKEKGIRRIYLLKDTSKENEFVSLTLWNSKSDADAYESSGHFSANRDKVRELLEEDPGVSQFEVEYHTVGQALPPPRASKKPKARKARRSSKRRRR